jgi:hypothetical protein
MCCSLVSVRVYMSQHLGCAGVGAQVSSLRLRVWVSCAASQVSIFKEGPRRPLVFGLVWFVFRGPGFGFKD